MTEVITELKRLEPEAYERLKAEGRIIKRCKDCKHARYGNYTMGVFGHCEKLSSFVPEDGFCWQGEEK